MTVVAILAATGLGLLVVAVATARRVPALAALAAPDLDRYFDRWSELHGGYDPRGSAAARIWLSIVYRLARPLARTGVRPDVVTVATVWVAAAVWALAAAGERWVLLAAALLVVSGVLDNLDGAVAVLQGRTTRWGYVLDSAVDRVTDALYVVALVAVGGPGELAVAVGFAMFLLEYVRARAGNVTGDDVGRITVAERPNRVIFAALTLLAAGVVPGEADAVATLGLAVLGGLTLVGLGQFMVAVHRRLHVAG